ncbi:hypothetical protein Ato02nite_061040 [Paractinoplanes toevensis]|uniref:Uncharacterized protein n=1 Tax=Paractinoplanes toevensis TaxID=571911 RepID=A0A919W8K3_9ACTN|nr:hypothetical protein Ato02nite_061040 [Actinoplanes toevensis]
MVDGSGRKPVGNALVVAVTTLATGDGVALPLEVTTHGEPLGVGTADAVVLALQPPTSSSAALPTSNSQRRRTARLPRLELALSRNQIVGGEEFA